MTERGKDARCQYMSVVRELKGPRPVSRCRPGREVLGREAPDQPGHGMREWQKKLRTAEGPLLGEGMMPSAPDS